MPGSNALARTCGPSTTASSCARRGRELPLPVGSGGASAAERSGAGIEHLWPVRLSRESRRRSLPPGAVRITSRACSGRSRGFQGRRQARAAAAQSELSVLRSTGSPHHRGVRGRPACLSTALAQLFASRHNDDRKVIAFSDTTCRTPHTGARSSRRERGGDNGLRAAIAQVIEEERRYRSRRPAGSGAGLVEVGRT